MMDMFDRMADEIFERAGVSKDGNEDLHKRASEIMAQCMALGSVNYGLSDKRFDYTQEQKDTLVQDLIELKAAGEIQ